MIVRELVTLLGFQSDASGARQHDRTLDRLENKANQVAANVGSTVQNAIRGIYAALGGAAILSGLQGITKASDEITTAMNRITASLQGTDDPERVFERLYEAAKESGVEVDALSSAFMKFAPSMRDAGKDADVTVDMLNGLQKGLLAAGSSAAQAAEVMRQLGQAMNKGKFDGDELKSFLEGSSPTLVDTFARALGTTRDKLQEMGSEGKLVAKNVIPALIEAAKAGGAEFDAMAVTVDLAMKRSRVVLTRFLAEFDKAIGLSRLIIRGFEAIGTRLESWRQKLPILRDLINEMGGIERILAVIATALGIGIGLWVAYNRAALIAAIRTAAAFAPWVLGGLAIAAVAALVMDFVEWVGGEDVDSLFRRWFGPFEDIRAKYAPQIDGLKDAWENFKGAVGDAYVSLSADGEKFWGPLLEFFGHLWRAIDSTGQALGQFALEGVREFQAIKAAISDSIGTAINLFQTVIGWIDRAVAAWNRWLGRDQATPNEMRDQGTGDAPRRGTLAPFTPLAGNEDFRNDMRNLLNFGSNPAPIAGAIGRSGSGGTVNAPQTNTFQQSVTVNAPAADPASVAAAANQGVTRANEASLGQLREAQVNMPLTEAPAQ